MEYLMTYGWAILIISVVLVALFQLGVFNQYAFAPRQQPGSCYVFRPYGPHSSSLIALSGVCTNSLPEYVGSFNGGSTYIATAPVDSAQMTISIWVSFTSTSQSSQGMVGLENGGCNQGYELFLEGDYVKWRSNGPFADVYTTSFIPNVDQWYNIVATYNGFTATLYRNGTVLASTNGAGSLVATATNTILGAIGAPGPFEVPPFCSGYLLNGQMSNVQIYNTSLSANEVQALYLEGIGGAPTVLQNLAAWWPLNGNGNDYGGNNYNATVNPTANTVFYTGQWTTGYSVP